MIDKQWWQRCDVPGCPDPVVEEFYICEDGPYSWCAKHQRAFLERLSGEKIEKENDETP